MRAVAFIVAMGIAAASWVACACAMADSSMACCVKVQHQCSKMEQMQVCCPTRQPTSSESNAARLEPIASLLAQSNAGFLARAAVLPIVQDPFHIQQTSAEVSPPTRHSIDCILLI